MARSAVSASTMTERWPFRSGRAYEWDRQRERSGRQQRTGWRGPAGSVETGFSCEIRLYSVNQFFHQNAGSIPCSAMHTLLGATVCPTVFDETTAYLEQPSQR